MKALKLNTFLIASGVVGDVAHVLSVIQEKMLSLCSSMFLVPHKAFVLAVNYFTTKNGIK